VVPRASILETEVAWLNSIKADLVVLRCFSYLLLNCYQFYSHFNHITLAISSLKIELEGIMDLKRMSDIFFLCLYKNRSRMLFQLLVVQQLTLEFALFVARTSGFCFISLALLSLYFVCFCSFY
jgi:hypothetical protein